MYGFVSQYTVFWEKPILSQVKLVNSFPGVHMSLEQVNYKISFFQLHTYRGLLIIRDAKLAVTAILRLKQKFHVYDMVVSDSWIQKFTDGS